MTRYSKTMMESLAEVREGFSPKQIKMAIGIANDPRYKGGNYSGAVKTIEKIKKGLSNHKQVAAVLKRLNTDFDPEIKDDDEEMTEASARRDAMRHGAGGRRGIDPADRDDIKATDKDQELAKKNMIMQLRKSKDTKGNFSIEFQDGKKQKVDPKFVELLLKAHDMIQKPRDKEQFVQMISKSYRDMLKTAKMVSKQLRMGEEVFLEGFEVEEVEIDEMKMDDPKLNKIFDKLKKGQTIKLKTSSTISKGKDFVDYIVKSKNTVNKGRVEKVTLVTKGNEKSVKKFLYKRDGKVTFAIGDMGASIDDIKEGTWALPKSPKAKAELKKLMSKPIKLGKDGDEASDKLYSLIGDDELFDDLYVAGKKNPKGDARDVVKKHMKRLGIKEELDDIKEAKSSTGYELYHKDFSSAMKHAYDFAKKKFGIEVDPKEIDDKVATGPKKPSNGKTNSYSLKAKGGKKGIQVQVYNTGKNYELNMYKEEVISEEEEPQKSDGAKAVDQGREDKKKTRIAQLQLQIAKAQETINQLNAQEK